MDSGGNDVVSRLGFGVTVARSYGRMVAGCHLDQTTLEAWLTEKEEEGRSRQPEEEEGEESHSAQPFL
jgi:hypothetical protein